MTTLIPFKEGLFEDISGKWALVGGRCKQCEKIIYPLRTICLNCLSQDMEKWTLSRKGTLYSFTVVHMPSEHFEPPYVIGWIELPEGIRVFSPIRFTQEHSLRIGMAMELSVEKLWEVEEKGVLGYVFRPSEEQT